jgi:hypothetical protein
MAYIKTAWRARDTRIPCLEKFRVSSFKLVGRASVPANVGCALRTNNSAPLFINYGWAKGP